MLSQLSELHIAVFALVLSDRARCTASRYPVGRAMRKGMIPRRMLTCLSTQSLIVSDLDTLMVLVQVWANQCFRLK